MTNEIDWLEKGWEVLWNTLKIPLKYFGIVILVILIVYLAYKLFRWVFNKFRALIGKRPK